MATRAGVGMSHHHSPTIAGHEAAEQALKHAGVSKPDIVFMFATVGYDQRSLLQAVRGATGGAPLSGCSAEGTIGGDDADESNFSVGLFIFPDGTKVNFDHFFAGLEGNLSSDQFLPLWGGGAGDNLALVQTYQYCARVSESLAKHP